MRLLVSRAEWTGIVTDTALKEENCASLNIFSHQHLTKGKCSPCSLKYAVMRQKINKNGKMGERKSKSQQGLNVIL